MACSSSFFCTYNHDAKSPKSEITPSLPPITPPPAPLSPAPPLPGCLGCVLLDNDNDSMADMNRSESFTANIPLSLMSNSSAATSNGGTMSGSISTDAGSVGSSLHSLPGWWDPDRASRSGEVMSKQMSYSSSDVSGAFFFFGFGRGVG